MKINGSNENHRVLPPKRLAATICALANAEGGTIIIGLCDGIVEGLEGLTNKSRNDLRQAHIDHVQPPVRVEYSDVECLNEHGDRATLLVLQVPSSDKVHETRDGTCYLRVGDESIRLTFEQRRELVYDKDSSQFEAEVVDGATMEDLDLELLENYRTAISANQDVASLLRNRGLATKDGSITVAGYLLFGRFPQDRYPNAHIRIIKSSRR